MTIKEAIAEVRCVTRPKDPWTCDDFTSAQPAYEPNPLDHAIAAILNAVASGDLIPLSDHQLAVALAYQRAAATNKAAARALGQQASMADNVGHDTSADFDRYAGQMLEASAVDILALAPADALAEVETLRKEHEDCAVYLKDGETPRQRMDRDHADVLALMEMLAKDRSRREAAEAEVARLQAALYLADEDCVYVDLYSELADMRGAYNIARAALTPKGATNAPQEPNEPTVTKGT